ncbi:hypothetical protein ER308_20855 [Egibacter rhizosphaerae]|uniref:Uncharacterized protein n=1 Tax=Egibacter rhizosphaerae TaxID=1670831 RepID=A0A411YKP6_9ACTN|nr:hypothetical protein [Egibacter rhizosphaerae]QBI21765.1 hypothetical protein ER308_20855 [Egibacter rhizosphaerae]
MTTFDPEAGVLRVRHAALAVLALLATEPASQRLHDHAVAEPLAELRRAGLVGRGGLEPAVAPLAHAVGAARLVADLVASDHGTTHRARLWLGPEAEGAGELAVVGLALPDDPDTYALMADVPGQAPALLAELVGLGTVSDPPVEGSRRLPAEAFVALVAADEGLDRDEVLTVAGDDEFGRALADGLKGAGLRWRLTVVDGPELWVLDAGASGLWLAHREETDASVIVRPVSGVAAREAIGELLRG